VSSPAGRRRLVLAIAVLGVAILVPLVLVSIPPSGWSPVPADPAAAEARGEALERFLSAEFSKVRTDDAPWAIRLREDDVNAWIATRLPKWEANAGNPPPPAAEVRFRAGGVSLRIALAGFGVDPVLEAGLAPAVIDGPGGTALTLRLKSVSLGRLPLPRLGASLISASLRAAGLSAATPSAVSTVTEDRHSVHYGLSDGRTVRLDAIAVEDGALVLEFRTLPR
jgi:hypothetical protein